MEDNVYVIAAGVLLLVFALFGAGAVLGRIEARERAAWAAWERACSEGRNPPGTRCPVGADYD